jgi:hypothetical protein
MMPNNTTGEIFGEWIQSMTLEDAAIVAVVGIIVACFVFFCARIYFHTGEAGP